MLISIKLCFLSPKAERTYKVVTVFIIMYNIEELFRHFKFTNGTQLLCEHSALGSSEYRMTALYGLEA